MREHYERQRQEVQRNVEAVDIKIQGLMIPTDRFLSPPQQPQ